MARRIVPQGLTTTILLIIVSPVLQGGIAQGELTNFQLAFVLLEHIQYKDRLLALHAQTDIPVSQQQVYQLPVPQVNIQMQQEMDARIVMPEITALVGLKR